jgi:hypothetical protein
MAIELAHKPENSNPQNPYIVIKHVGSELPEYIARAPYGIWIRTGRETARPLGSGRGIADLESAIRDAQYRNANFNAPSESGQMYA